LKEMTRGIHLLPGSWSAAALAAFALSSFTAAYAQTNDSCSVVENVGVVFGEPFTAQRLIHTNVFSSRGGAPIPQQIVESVARDIAGRISTEQHVVTKDPVDNRKAILTARDGTTIVTTASELQRTVRIFDCPHRKIITLDMGRQIAFVDDLAAPPPATENRLYSSLFNPLVSGKFSSDSTFEDLGEKYIDGTLAHGFKTTQLGSQGDGDWYGRAVKITEIWVSDDLAATLVEVDTYPRLKTEDTSTLTNIQREQPDRSLFEIPVGFWINPPMSHREFKLTYLNQ
jgi:hypothetical protein